MDCPTCYVNSTPEHVPVTITNNTIAVNIDTTRVMWVVDTFTLAQSAGGLGLTCFLSKAAVHGSEVQVFLDNVHQEPSVAYSVGSGLDRVTLAVAMAADQKLVVRYLAYASASLWVTETLRPQNSTDGLGAEFTLGQTPEAGAAYIYVLKGAGLLTYGVDFSVVGAVLTLLGDALAAGETLVVTYLPD